MLRRICTEFAKKWCTDFANHARRICNFLAQNSDVPNFTYYVEVIMISHFALCFTFMLRCNIYIYIYIPRHRSKMVLFSAECNPLALLVHIWDVTLVWRKGNIEKNSLCYSIVYYYNVHKVGRLYRALIFLGSAVLVSAPGTSPTWLPHMVVDGVQVQVCAVWQPAVVVSEVRQCLPKHSLCSVVKFVLESCVSISFAYIEYIQHEPSDLCKVVR